MALKRSFCDAQSISSYNTKCLLYHSKVDQYPSDVSSNRIHRFTCTCGSKYIERTGRRIHTSTSEHISGCEGVKSLRMHFPDAWMK